MAVPRPTLTRITDDSSLVQMWLAGKNKRTKELYLQVVNHFLEFVGRTLNEVLLEDVVQWMESLRYRGYTQNTVVLKISVIRSLFSYGFKAGYLDVNVTALIKVPPQTSAIHERFLEQEEVRQFINSISQQRGRVLLTLIYTTGLRVSEALNINWRDLKSNGLGGQVTVMGKGGKLRTVLISPNLWQLLQALPRPNNCEPLFSTSSGKRLDRYNLHRFVKREAEKAGVNPHISIHWLRHAHACHSLENGCELDVLMRSLGHSSLTVTSQYLHARPNEGSSQFIDF
jgi:integrase/recombinase XerD